MNRTAPTFSQIKAQVAAIRGKYPETRTIAIRTQGRWSGQSEQHDGDQTYAIHQCDSPLAMRLALREANTKSIHILLTPLDESQISEDILVRLKPRKIVPLDSREIVKSLFQARTVDPRLIKHRWIAEMLLEIMPERGYSPVAGGFLDAETVWPILLGRSIGLSSPTPDLLSLLQWSAESDNVAKFRGMDDYFRDAAKAWLVSLAGPTAAVILDCVARHEQADAMAIGLAAGVVFHPDTGGRMDRAQILLQERFLGRERPEPVVISAWHAAATDSVRTGLNDPSAKKHQLVRADAILKEIEADTFAWLSDTSPMGFDQRLMRFAEQLNIVVSADSVGAPLPLLEAKDAIARHDLHAADHNENRILLIEMALRLVRWLAPTTSSATPCSLADAAGDYLREGGYIDWARLSLQAGDSIHELSTAYAKLFDRVTEVMEQRAEVFARLLCDWTAVQTTDATMVPVEEILDRVVAPLAAQAPVLVIVMDGMSVAVFRELMNDILHQDWVLLAEEGVGLRPGLATVPSVTEVSRTSLLTGQRLQGNQGTEKSKFPEHPALLKACRKDAPPVIYHKGPLREGGDPSLPTDVRNAVLSSQRKVVAVVVNAIDDHLTKGEQINTRWTHDRIKMLPALLREARVAKRTVILLSDHGHVLDHNAVSNQTADHERWRSDDGQPEAGEMTIHGPRVVIPDDHKLIAPWTEKLRYVNRRNGYHGGLSPQEMVVPIAVLGTRDTTLAGWEEAPFDLPDWWDLTDQDATPSPQPKTPKIKPVPKKAPESLFDLPAEDESDDEVESPSDPTTQWITALLASPIFEEQKKFAGRRVPRDDDFARLLTALDHQGGKVTSTALSRAIDFPPTRLDGLLTQIRRVLNVDGYDVLLHDRSSDTITLDRDLLLKQFDLT